MGLLQRRLRSFDWTREDLTHAEVEDQLRSVVEGLGVTIFQPAQPIEEVGIRDNAMLLLAGEHRGFRISKNGTKVEGAPGAVVTRLARVNTTSGPVTKIGGIHFLARTSSSDNAASLVTVSATSRVVFNDCTFERYPMSSGDYVSIASGGTAQFFGCNFIGTQTAGFVVNNAAAVPLNVYISGSYNTTGRLHNNCTIISELL
jgi:hypothetical protein